MKDNVKIAAIIAGTALVIAFFYWYMSPFQQCMRYYEGKMGQTIVCMKM